MIHALLTMLGLAEAYVATRCVQAIADGRWLASGGWDLAISVLGFVPFALVLLTDDLAYFIGPAIGSAVGTAWATARGRKTT